MSSLSFAVMLSLKIKSYSAKTSVFINASCSCQLKPVSSSPMITPSPVIPFEWTCGIPERSSCVNELP
ncbi:MAG: hypothetical protein IPH11_04600 [Ignavibacteriales bacterium]|nr:hypothetical protein [Ignavibacteriales bacterium]